MSRYRVKAEPLKCLEGVVARLDIDEAPKRDAAAIIFKLLPLSEGVQQDLRDVLESVYISIFQSESLDRLLMAKTDRPQLLVDLITENKLKYPILEAHPEGNKMLIAIFISAIHNSLEEVSEYLISESIDRLRSNLLTAVRDSDDFRTCPEEVYNVAAYLSNDFIDYSLIANSFLTVSSSEEDFHMMFSICRSLVDTDNKSFLGSIGLVKQLQALQLSTFEFLNDTYLTPSGILAFQITFLVSVYANCF